MMTPNEPLLSDPPPRACPFPWAALVAGIVVSFLVGVTFDRYWLQTHPQTAAIEFSTTGTGSVYGMYQMPSKQYDLQDADFKQFWDLWDLLKQKYYEQPVKDKQLFYGAMSGLASSLGDPYTTYFEPKNAQSFQEALSGKFEGIGAQIDIKDDQLVVVAPLPDSPAEKAGLLAGDAIVKIDGQDTSGMSVDQAVSMIRGAKGTVVKLNIYRPATKKAPFDVTITRDEIHIKSVTWKMLPGNIAYIDVTNFNGDTEGLFSSAADEIRAKDPKGLILDLRNNPGGYLDTAQSMAGEWVGDGIVVKERRQGQIFETLKGTGRNRLHGIPTVVLVNQGSASASEIVAGALQDTKAATIVGMKTFGKGSVQDYMTFKDGSGVKITIAEWLTPNERTINKTGLDPDVTVDRTAEDYDAKRDPQLDRAVGILNGTAPASNATSTGAAPSAPRP